MTKLLLATAAMQVLFLCIAAKAQDISSTQDLPSSDPVQNQDVFPIEPLLFAQPLFADAAPTPPTASPDVAPSTQPSTPGYTAGHPEEASANAGQFPGMGSTFGLTEFFNHFAPYEPVYFIGGAASPNVKFQISIRYRIFTPTGPMATKDPWLKGFNLAYSQMSLWNLNAPSAPFFDTSYRPEVFYYLENIKGVLPASSQLGFQIGLGHESNGRDGPQSRSLNIAYIRPIIDLPLFNSKTWFLTFAPKLYTYIGSLSDNPDIAEYRGYADIRLVFGQRDGLQLAALGRIGNQWNKGSIQLDLTYPLTKLLHGNADISFDLQFFNGFGESLLTYNERTQAIRFGIAIVR